MRPIFLDVQVGDVVAVNPPREKAYLAQVLYVEAVSYTHLTLPTKRIV